MAEHEPLSAEELRRERVELDLAKELYRKEPTRENYLTVKRLMMRALRRRRRSAGGPGAPPGVSRWARSMAALEKRLRRLKEREGRR